ncbi:MAG: flagellar basal body rod protein FlgB [Tepidanaerobacteraceae bacterium]|jgi:flagellar basal-body rod protein FlgB
MFGYIELMQKYMDAKWLRNEVISNNIANVDTPGFKRSDVSFEELLKSKLKQDRLRLSTTNKGHINNISMALKEPQVYVQRDTVYRNDENNVDIDNEMVQLTKNTLSYNILADQTQKRFQLLRTAISEGRR